VRLDFYSCSISAVRERHHQKLSREIAEHENLLKCSANIYLDSKCQLLHRAIKIPLKKLAQYKSRTLNLVYFKVKMRK
jgi:hypothetical protein